MAEVMEREMQILHTEVIGTDEQDTLKITPNAIDMINKVRQDNSVPDEYYLRLGTQSGGCSGMNYIIGFDSEVYDHDKMFELNDLNILVDRKSLFYLMGVTLDFVDDVNGSGFVFNNPNNVKTCGCGGGGHHH